MSSMPSSARLFRNGKGLASRYVLVQPLGLEDPGRIESLQTGVRQKI
jgi:hypothetical protein